MGGSIDPLNPLDGHGMVTPGTPLHNEYYVICFTELPCFMSIFVHSFIPNYCDSLFVHQLISYKQPQLVSSEEHCTHNFNQFCATIPNSRHHNQGTKMIQAAYMSTV